MRGKGSELQEGDPLRKFKGRTVFQGNNVKDEADVALFSELGSSPANMEAGKKMPKPLLVVKSQLKEPPHRTMSQPAVLRGQSQPSRKASVRFVCC